MGIIGRTRASIRRDGWMKAAVKGARYPLRSPFILREVKHALHNPAAGLVSLHCPNYVKPDASDEAIVERVFRSFGKMKQHQSTVAQHYSPSSQWQELIDDAYSYLNAGMMENDLDKFHFFLANFGAWEKYTGVESSPLIRSNMGSISGRAYLQNEIFYSQLKIWKWFYGNRKSVSVLSYPMHGNQVGAYIDDVFVGAGSFFSEIYGSLLSELLRDCERPVVADLGAGYGKLAYFTLRDLNSFTFVDFDLPETLCLAAYYLMKVWPDKSAVLYGEEDYSPSLHAKYDLIFMPSWEIEKTRSSTVELFINKNSLGEMTKDAVRNYVSHITKCTKYFFHMNHEISRDILAGQETGMLGYEYPVPMEEFTLLSRYPDMGHLLYKGSLDFNTDIFVYLYQRKALPETLPTT